MGRSFVQSNTTDCECISECGLKERKKEGMREGTKETGINREDYERKK